MCDGNRRGRTKKRLSDPLQLGGVGGFANALHITHGGKNAERQHAQTGLAQGFLLRELNQQLLLGGGGDVVGVLQEGGDALQEGGSVLLALVHALEEDLDELDALEVGGMAGNGNQQVHDGINHQTVVCIEQSTFNTQVLLQQHIHGKMTETVDDRGA